MFSRELELGDKTLTVDQHLEGDTGVVVWDAGLVLAKYLEVSSSLVAGKTVVELGSGTGAVGIAAAVLGANVILTDLEENLDLLNHNIKNNLEHLDTDISAHVLKWGDKPAIKTILKERRFDVILVADCVYYKECLVDLVNTMVELSDQNTQVLLSFEERDSAAKVAVQKEFTRLMEVHFNCSEVPEKQQHPDFSSPDIRVLNFKPNKNKIVINASS